MSSSDSVVVFSPPAQPRARAAKCRRPPSWILFAVLAFALSAAALVASALHLDGWIARGVQVLCSVAIAGLAVAACARLRRHEREAVTRQQELEWFASRVAHDIRDPLGPAMSALDSIAYDRGPVEPRRRNAERGLQGLRRVDDLVSDLLAFARSGAPPDPAARASIRTVVAGVVHDLDVAACAARVDVQVEPLPACRVACARGVLTSVVLNLVGNAIKHLPDGWSPRVVVVAARTGDDVLRVEVTDTGAGISVDRQDRLFEPYVRGDSARPGLGLGLATVKRLVVSHGGAVGLRSRPGGGATFWFELPIWADATPD
jgi:signal transduction histidine kinase